MIKIFKDNVVKFVTKGAYENSYKHLGYNVVSEYKENNYNYVRETREKKDKDIVKEKDNEKETRK